MKKKLTVGVILAVAVVVGAMKLSGDTVTSEIIENASVQASPTLASDIELTETITIVAGGTQVITGVIAAGQIIVDAGDEDVTLVLNGVDITNASGAAIYILEAGDVTVEIADGSVNKLTQTGFDADEDQKAALYSSSDLEIIGGGELVVVSTVADGISSSDDLFLTEGNIVINAADDGIRGKDSVTISGGTITIDSVEDGIKSTNDKDLGRGVLTITDGIITINSGDDAIKAEQEILISGGTINIVSSVEGIEAPVIVIDGGDISLYATDDGINASASDIITSGLSITINGGTVNVEVAAGDTDALDSNEDLYVNGGIVNITTPRSSFDFDGSGSINGGTVTVNGEVITEMPQQRGGGGHGG